MRISAKLIADWKILIFFHEGKQKTQDSHLLTLQIVKEIKTRSNMQNKTTLKVTEVICPRKKISIKGIDDVK